MSIKRGMYGIALASAKEVKATRKTLALTQKEFADLLGASHAVVTAWESGKITPNELESKVMHWLAKTPEIATEFARV